MFPMLAEKYKMQKAIMSIIHSIKVYLNKNVTIFDTISFAYLVSKQNIASVIIHIT